MSHSPEEPENAEHGRSSEEDDWKKSIEEAAQQGNPSVDAEKDANLPGPEAVQRVRLARMQREYDPSKPPPGTSPDSAREEKSKDGGDRQ
ncbi:MAG: hypothetical protein ACOCX4_00105 [Planctomycetota bacterium]